MADEGNSVIHADYNRRIAELNAENQRRRQITKDLKAQLAERDEKLKGATAELAKYQKDYEAAKKAAEDAQAKLDTAPDEWKAKYEEATGKLREIEHKAVFHKIAKDAGVMPEALGDLWDLTKYKAESDTVDEAAISKLIGDAVTARPYLKAAPNGQAPGGAIQTPAPALNPAAGASRGAPDTSSGKFRVSRAQAADPAWMRENFKAVQAATKAGTLEAVD